jgi:hypothetical protein
MPRLRLRRPVPRRHNCEAKKIKKFKTREKKLEHKFKSPHRAGSPNTNMRASSRSIRPSPMAAPGRRPRWGALAALCTACAGLYLLHEYETFAISRISLYDPFGGVTLFPRVHTPCNTPACEAIAPRPVTRGEDKVTVILMGYKTSRIANYRLVFQRYLAMPNTVDRVVFIWNNVNNDPPEVGVSLDWLHGTGCHQLVAVTVRRTRVAATPGGCQVAYMDWTILGVIDWMCFTKITRARGANPSERCPPAWC